MRGKLARVLRKLSNFDPKEEREYYVIRNSKNHEIVNNELVPCEGTIFEVTKDENDKFTPVTKRYMYRKTKQEVTRKKL